MANVTLSNLGPIDIQPSQQYSQQEINALIQQLQVIENAVNQLVAAVTALQTTPGTVPKHELAQEGGLGPVHTVSGLTAGNVLVALSASVAGFAQLALEQLAGMSSSVADPQDGDALLFQDGYWQAAPPPGGELDESYLTFSNSTSVLPNSRRLQAGENVVLDASAAGILTVDAEPVGDGPLGFVITGTGSDSDPEYLFPQDAFYTTFAGAA